MIPSYQPKDVQRIQIPFSKIAWGTVLLPFFSFIFCVIWSILFNFEDATFTHCKVDNYLPSISAAIGSFSPQKYIWKLAICIHFLPRLYISKMYKRYYIQILLPEVKRLANGACVLYVIENFALLGLTLISSTQNYVIHEKCFIVFMVSSECYMLLICYLLKTSRRWPPDNVEARSLRQKLQLIAINITCALLATYFFYRHNMYCETGVYSIFAMFEYVVVLTNMAFHMTAYWDFHGINLYLSINGIEFS